MRERMVRRIPVYTIEEHIVDQPTSQKFS